MRRSVVIFVATGAYLGYAPVASGTFGTLAGLLSAQILVIDDLHSLFLGPRGDMDQIAAAVRKIKANTGALAKA